MSNWDPQPYPYSPPTTMASNRTYVPDTVPMAHHHSNSYSGAESNQRPLPPLPGELGTSNSNGGAGQNGHGVHFNGYAAGHPGPDEEEPEEYIVRVRPRPVAPVDDEGQLTTHRALSANQVTMITLGGTFGTGLLVSSGQSLNYGGPLGLLIAYSFIGFICYCVMTSLCEMATYLPHKKGFVGYVSSYVHPAVGFGLGWTYLCQFLIVPASHINTAATVLQFAGFTVDDTPGGQTQTAIGRKLDPSAVWRLIFTLAVVGINFLGVRGFGHFEFWLSTFKIIVLIALIFFGIIVDLGGARLKSGEFDRIGFRWWGPDSGPMGHAHLAQSGSDDLNRFLGWWAVMVRILFSYMGIELIGVVVGEARNPRKTVPAAIKRTYRLVFTLYILGAIVIGLIVRSDDPTFTSSNPVIAQDNQQSPFTIAANHLAARGLVPIISAAIIIFALSGATSNIYTGSRLLYGLTLDHQAPQFLRQVTAGGRPIAALIATAVWSFLSYIGQDDKTSTNAYAYFLDLTSTAGAIAWICILIAHLRFRGALNAQRFRLDTLRYRSPMYPYGTWFSLIATIVFTIFKGYEPYVKRKVPGIIVAYILVVFFFVLIIFWKWYRKGEARATPLERIDLTQGVREIDLEEENYEIRKSRRGVKPRPWYQRLLTGDE